MNNLNRRSTDARSPDSVANLGQVGGSHYKRQAIQHWDYVLANNIPYMEAQVIKYVSRWRVKNGVQDLEKARHFLEKLIEVSLGPATLGEAGPGYVNQDR